MSGKLLKLVAIYDEDIVVQITLLQDAVVPMSDMIYITGEDKFSFVEHQLREGDAGQKNPGQDTRAQHRDSGLLFLSVQNESGS